MVTIEMYTCIAVQCLKTGLQNVDEEQEESTIIRFVMEQLQLAITNKFCRHLNDSECQNEIFRRAKQMVKERQDITGLNCIKGASGSDCR